MDQREQQILGAMMLPEQGKKRKLTPPERRTASCSVEDPKPRQVTAHDKISLKFVFFGDKTKPYAGQDEN